MTNTGTITITWDEDDMEVNVSENLRNEVKLLTEVGSLIFLSGLKIIREVLGDRQAGDIWRGVKEIVENEVFVYTVRVPRWLRGQEENNDDD